MKHKAQYPALMLLKRHWIVLLIPIPWLFVILWFEGLTRPVPTFHDGDETIYHYPIIQKFAQQIPQVDLRDYPSATTPGYHLIFAVFHRWLQFDLPQLRLLNAIISIVAVIVLYALLTQRSYPPYYAFLNALLFGLSPYYFGAGFRLLTDNLSLALVLMSLLHLKLLSIKGSTLNLVAAYMWASFSMLTRQLSAWLLVAIASQSFSVEKRLFCTSRFLLSFSLTCVAALPIGILFLLWGGFTPPYFQGSHGTATMITVVKNFVFSISLYTAYHILLRTEDTLYYISKLKDRAYLLAFVFLMITSTLTLWMFDCIPTKGDDGILWRISSLFPRLGGSSLLFYIMMPIGMFILASSIAKFVRIDSFAFSLIVGQLAFLLVNFANGKIFQKYYDTYLLLFLMLIAPSKATKIAVLTRVLLLLAYVGYFLAKVR